MPIDVKVPLGFLHLTGGRLRVEVEAATVGLALESLVRDSPSLAGMLTEEDAGGGESARLKRGVRVFVNGRDVRRLDRLDTALADGDRVAVVAAISGG